MKKLLKKATMIFFIVIAGYLNIGNLFHRIIFPEKKPVLSSWFKPVQVLYSKSEGFFQKVIKHENGFVHCSTIIEPFADGPPKHIHTGFDETFQVDNEELSVWVDVSDKKLKPGEILHIPKGTPHKPFSETSHTIYLRGLIAFPEKFAFNLTQVYALMETIPGFLQSSKAMMQMPFFQTSGFDSYTSEGPPVLIQQLSGYLIPPALIIRVITKSMIAM